MPVSRLHDGVKFIEPKKEIKVTAQSRISQFADFARMIMNRYLVRSVYEFSSASFVFADWFQEDRDAGEGKRQEREILRLLAAVRDFQRENQLPSVYKQLMQQINRTVTVYENRLGEKSAELLFLCREVSRQGGKASEYLREPETERRFARLVMQSAGPGRAVPTGQMVQAGQAVPERAPEKLAPDWRKPERPESARTKMFTGRFHTGLENRVRKAGRIPSYTERFLNAKRESTECFYQVFTERLPLIRFVETLSREEKEQIQKLFPELFAEHADLVNVLTSMPKIRWAEWKKQVMETAFPEAEQLTARMGEYREKTGQFMEEEDSMDHISAREQEQAAGKLAFLSVFSGTETSEHVLETILNDSGAEWARTERIFLEMSGEEEIQKLKDAYQKEKKALAEQISEGKIQNLLHDRLALEFAREVLKLEETGSVRTENLERPEDGAMNEAAVMDELLRKIDLRKKERERDGWTAREDRPFTVKEKESADWEELAGNTELAGRTEVADDIGLAGRAELSYRIETAGRAESSGHAEMAGRMESEGRIETTGRVELADRTETARRTDMEGRTEPAGRTEPVGRTEPTGRTESAGHMESVSQTGFVDRAAGEQLAELLKVMAEFTVNPDAGVTGVTGEKGFGRKKDNDSDVDADLNPNSNEKTDTELSGQGTSETGLGSGAGMAAGKLALMMTVSELYSGGKNGLGRMIPELTMILSGSEESWEKAQTVLLHGRINELEKGDAREPGIIYSDWKHFLDQAAGLEPEKAENRNSQILLSVMREFMKETFAL